MSWRPKPRGFRHAVHFKLSDGRRIVRIVGANRRSYTLRGVPRRVRATVTVTGLTRLNGKGPKARASAGPVRRRPRGA